LENPSAGFYILQDAGAFFVQLLVEWQHFHFKRHSFVDCSGRAGGIAGYQVPFKVIGQG
jgi:hypothetical protein